MWQVSNRFDPDARAIADRHYNRQKPGTPQFVPPGRCLVLKRSDAFWVTSWPFARYVRHAWKGAWVCSAFRNEGQALSSELIQAAVEETCLKWRPPPYVLCPYCDEWVCMVTFVDAKKTRRKRDPGRCYIKAGFSRCKGKTKGGLHVVHL